MKDGVMDQSGMDIHSRGHYMPNSRHDLGLNW